MAHVDNLIEPDLDGPSPASPLASSPFLQANQAPPEAPEAAPQTPDDPTVGELAKWRKSHLTKINEPMNTKTPHFYCHLRMLFIICALFSCVPYASIDVLFEPQSHENDWSNIFASIVVFVFLD